jgi:hypothetical protein
MFEKIRRAPITIDINNVFSEPSKSTNHGRRNMKKKLSTILTVLLIAMFAFSTADAGGGIKISSATFSLGSLITDGFLQGTGQTTITVILEAMGTCTLGEEPVPVSAKGSQILSGKEESSIQNNRRPFHVETTIQDMQGCSNNTEDQDGFVFWTKASISVYSGEVDINPCDYDFCEGLVSSAIQTSNPLLVQQDYNCTTNQDAHTVSCTPIRNPGSNNGGFAICHATGNNRNPYVLITINGNGLNGHGKHTGDIIPAPVDGCPR